MEFEHKVHTNYHISLPIIPTRKKLLKCNVMGVFFTTLYQYRGMRANAITTFTTTMFTTTKQGT